MILPELHQKAPRLIAHYQLSLQYLPNHYTVLPSWHLKCLKYFTKHPEDGNPRSDKSSAGWRALLCFHTTPTNSWHNPLVTDSCPTVIHSPLPLLLCFSKYNFQALWDSYAHYTHFSLQHAAHTFFDDETKPEEQTVTIKNVLVQHNLYIKTFTEICVSL